MSTWTWNGTKLFEFAWTSPKEYYVFTLGNLLWFTGNRLSGISELFRDIKTMNFFVDSNFTVKVKTIREWPHCGSWGTLDFLDLSMRPIWVLWAKWEAHTPIVHRKYISDTSAQPNRMSIQWQYPFGRFCKGNWTVWILLTALGLQPRHTRYLFILQNSTTIFKLSFSQRRSNFDHSLTSSVHPA